MAKKGGNVDVLITKRDITIDDVMNNPIAVGYLLDFCQKNLCAENLNFVMAVDRYKDKCELLDFNDEEDVKTCGAMAATIWKDFLSRNSPNEVSLPSEDRQVTIERMDKITKYKGKLFDVAIQDAMKTLQKDIMNRFIKSSQFSELVSRLSEATEAYDPFELVAPPNVTTTAATIETVEITLDSILGDSVLFDELHTYLNKKFNSENLKCVREICIFEDLAKEKDVFVTKKKAWAIYRNFVMPGSQFEVSCSNATRKNVMQRLGCPVEKMFDEVKETTMMTLKQDLKGFLTALDRKAIKDQLKKLEKGAKVGFVQNLSNKLFRK
ncbi:hypothetical protein H310_02769 [Aphanomyces invadans]|uniref:RGS domain-containing protein n=1 Tax=Aphanomyces invadans TaxID=157072 RepID=A0A024UL12_9STRA|nr:hypothetical protein H310_02769 [Aphanomyces invadans]ETW06542.1 hypothetical protein H310_02769 [Aphanomyces invadans]RHY30678.1 hypothetical protein DYB32_004110 [Aphanomyces invadans]|eukprot:XP_008864617.1 hypothetical protein H310_02769 [Aphanomyces invadans]